MRLCILTLLAFCMILVPSCKKKENLGLKDFDYLIFGKYVGNCTGDCATYYKLEQGQLYKDNMLTGKTILTFGTQPLAADKYNTAARVLPAFPEYLYAKPGATFGCPDCRQQGGYLVRLKKNGKEYNWHIDTDNNINPPEIKEFVTKVATALRDL